MFAVLLVQIQLEFPAKVCSASGTCWCLEESTTVVMLLTIDTEPFVINQCVFRMIPSIHVHRTAQILCFYNLVNRL